MQTQENHFQNEQQRIIPTVTALELWWSNNANYSAWGFCI